MLCLQAPENLFNQKRKAEKQEPFCMPRAACPLTNVYKALMQEGINLPIFPNAIKTQMTFDKVLYIRLQNSVKYQTFLRYFYVICLPCIYLSKHFIHYNSLHPVSVILFLTSA